MASIVNIPVLSITPSGAVHSKIFIDTHFVTATLMREVVGAPFLKRRKRNKFNLTEFINAFSCQA